MKSSTFAFLGMVSLMLFHLGWGEGPQICEFTPFSMCLDAAQDDGRALRVHESNFGIQSDAFSLCGQDNVTTASPDLVMIMDNTGSMDFVQTVDGIPRYCPDPDPMDYQPDPGCISGDPYNLRGPALHTLLDSANSRSDGKVNVGVVTFGKTVHYRSDALTQLNNSTLQPIKDEIRMQAKGWTNYTAAFRSAEELLALSQKPKNRQAVIFVSDGRPNWPQDDPFEYKQRWEDWPVVHCIFLGDNQENYQAMQEIASKTGGLFFAIRDVQKMADILTKDILSEILSHPVPSRTTISNQANGITYDLGPNDHIAASGNEFKLQMPGALSLAMGENPIKISTDMDDGTRSVFTINVHRNEFGPFDTPASQQCREQAMLTLLNSDGEEISNTGEPYLLDDPKLIYRIETTAQLDQLPVEVNSNQGDFESQTSTSEHKSGPGQWTNEIPFDHNSIAKRNDNLIQTLHGTIVTVTYRNPYLPQDSASVNVRIKLAADVVDAAYFDSDGNGSIDSMRIVMEEPLENTPSRLEFLLPGKNGEVHTRIATASMGEIQFGTTSSGIDRRIIEIKLSHPFPSGITDLAYTDSLGHSFTEPQVPVAENWFSISDSIAPAISRASVLHPDESDERRRLLIELTEPVDPDHASGYPIIVTRNGEEIPETDFYIDELTIDGNRLVIYFDPESPSLPIPGDSISLRRDALQDLQGNKVNNEYSVALLGKSPSQQLDSFDISQPSPQKTVEIPGPARFYVLDETGNPLEASSCDICGHIQNDNPAYPTISVVTKSPFKYTFRIFTNLGVPVAEGEGSVNQDQLSRLTPYSENGEVDKYKLKIVWNGKTSSQAHAAAGAYIIRAYFQFPQNARTGARPSEDMKMRLFGYAR